MFLLLSPKSHLRKVYHTRWEGYIWMTPTPVDASLLHPWPGEASADLHIPPFLVQEPWAPARHLFLAWEQSWDSNWGSWYARNIYCCAIWMAFIWYLMCVFQPTGQCRSKTWGPLSHYGNTRWEKYILRTRWNMLTSWIPPPIAIQAWSLIWNWNEKPTLIKGNILKGLSERLVSAIHRRILYQPTRSDCCLLRC